MTSTLPVSDIVNVSVVIGGTPAIPSGFNLGLIVGSSTVIPGSANDRVRLYSSLIDMTSDGFANGSAEYVAASLYFGQSMRSPKIAIGRWISTSESALSAVQACRLANTDWYGFVVCGVSDIDVMNIAAWAESAMPGVVYFLTTASATVLSGAVGIAQIETATLIGTITLAGNATITVTAAGMNASPKDIPVAVVINDTAAMVATKVITALAIDPDVSYMFRVSGTGTNVILTTKNKVDSDTALNIASTNGSCTGLTAAPTSVTTVAGVAGSLAAILKGNMYSHTIAQYSTQVADAIAAIMGYALGANTGVANSAYTLAYKAEVGVTPEVLSETQVGVIKGSNCNIYISRGSVYTLFEQGVMASGMHFDERIGIDQLIQSVQINIMNALIAAPKIPQTEGGMAELYTAINGPLATAYESGFLGEAPWTAAAILSLSNGDMVKGYKILSDSIAGQSSTDRASRKAPNIYIAIKLAGAIENVLVTVEVNE